MDGDLKAAPDAGDSSGSHVNVFKAPVTRRRMVAMACIWLACAMVYDGLNLNVGNLVTNLYLSVFFNRIAELPAYSLKAIMVHKFERRAMLIILKNRRAGVSREVASGLKRGCITWMRFLQNEEAIQGGGRSNTRRREWRREQPYAEGIGVEGRHAYWSRGGVKRGCIRYRHAY